MDKVDEITTIKELTGLLTLQLNEIVYETFGTFPKLIVYAMSTVNGDTNPKDVKGYDLNVVFAPLEIDSVGPVESTALAHVLNWSKRWLVTVLS